MGAGENKLYFKKNEITFCSNSRACHLAWLEALLESQEPYVLTVETKAPKHILPDPVLRFGSKRHAQTHTQTYDALDYPSTYIVLPMGAAGIYPPPNFVVILTRLRLRLHRQGPPNLRQPPQQSPQCCEATQSLPRSHQQPTLLALHPFRYEPES